MDNIFRNEGDVAKLYLTYNIIVKYKNEDAIELNRQDITELKYRD